MGKRVTRITVLGFTVATTAALAAPGVASAQPSPVLGGDCAATLQNGQPRGGLVLDAGALLNAPGLLGIGLDSRARNGNGSAPLLALPLGDTVKALGVGEVPVVGDLAARTVCPVAQKTVNTVGSLTQGVVGRLPVPPAPNPPNPNPPNPNPPQPVPPSPNPPQPNPPSPNPPQPNPPGQTPPGDSTGPIVSGPGNAGLPGDTVAGIVTSTGLLPGGVVQAPVTADVIPGVQVPPTVDEEKSGSVEALPPLTAPAKLPMLLAVLALALVAAALVRAWIRRSPA